MNEVLDIKRQLNQDPDYQTYAPKITPVATVEELPFPKLTLN